MNAATIDWKRHFLMLADVIEERLAHGRNVIGDACRRGLGLRALQCGQGAPDRSRVAGHADCAADRGRASGLFDAHDMRRFEQDRDAVAGALDGIARGASGCEPPILICSSILRHGRRPRSDAARCRRSDRFLSVVERCAAGLDFVGFYAGGALVRGFASSGGSRGWHEVENFNFSWSLYDASGRAIKTTYASEQWSDETFARKIEEAAARMPVLARAAAHAGAGFVSRVAGAECACRTDRHGVFHGVFGTAAGDRAQRTLSAQSRRRLAGRARHADRGSRSRHRAALQRGRLSARDGAAHRGGTRRAATHERADGPRIWIASQRSACE